MFNKSRLCSDLFFSKVSGAYSLSRPGGFRTAIEGFSNDVYNLLDLGVLLKMDFLQIENRE
jgi:hypothetical protein